jgi:hypothetical protein
MSLLNDSSTSAPAPATLFKLKWAVRSEHALTSWQSTVCYVAVQITLDLKGEDRMFDVGRLAIPAIGYFSSLYDTQH